MCRCTARGGCESEKGKKSWADEGSRRKPAISYAKQSGNTRCMHTASPRSKIIEHGPFHRKVAWKGRHADFSRSNPPPLTLLLPPPRLRSCNVFFRIVSRGAPRQPFREIRTYATCVRAPRATVVRYSKRATRRCLRANLSGDE